MNINIDIDLGNAWEMLSAIGTIGTVIVALYLANKRNNEPVIIHSVTCSDKYYGEVNSWGDSPEIDRRDKTGAKEIEVKGRIEFYNPSDDPKTLTNLKVRSQFGRNEGNFLEKPILTDQKQYISLNPKQTRLIDFTVMYEIEEVFFDKTFFYEVSKHTLLCTDEDKNMRVKILSES